MSTNTTKETGPPTVEVRTTRGSLRYLLSEWNSRTWWGRCKMFVWGPAYLLLVSVVVPVGLYLWVRQRLPETYKNDRSTAQEDSA